MRFEYDGRLRPDPPLDLSTTLESGQTFLWTREDGEMYENQSSQNPVYTRTKLRDSGEVMCVRVLQDEDALYWEATHPDAEEYLTEVFRLDQDHHRIRQTISENDLKGVVEEATREFPGLRVINEPLFETLISFICSPQASVGRIHGMVQSLSEQYGTSVAVSGHEYAAFPTVEQLAGATEEELENLSLGYRASRIHETVEMIQSGTHPLEPLPSDPGAATRHLTEYPGVGGKVANCVLLYAGVCDSVVPVDVWVDRAVQQYYPEFSDVSREKAARELEQLWGEYAGHAQAYLFHYMRMTVEK